MVSVLVMRLTVLADITDDLTLPATSDLPNNDADVAYRTTFIGTTASPLWVMVKSKFGSTTASESYYSTDLKTWTVSTSFYTNGDYRAVRMIQLLSATAEPLLQQKRLYSTLALMELLKII